MKLVNFFRSFRWTPAYSDGSRTLWILGFALLAFSTVCHAQEFNEPDSSDTPWNVLSTAPYVSDPTFNGGIYKVETFLNTFANSSFGRKIVRLPNGDVIVAGVVPASAGSLRTPINLGLVKYDSTGLRVTWTNPGMYGVFSNKNIVFPNDGDPTNDRNVKDVLDMKVLGNRIFVLVDHKYQGGNDTDSRILVFGTDGAYLGFTNVFDTANDEYSGGMVIYSSLTFPETITVLATGTTFDGVWRPTFVSGTVNSDDSITFNSPVFPNPGNYCPANRGCILRSIDKGKTGATGAPNRFYLAGARQSNIPDNNAWNFLVMAVSASGSPVTSFGGSGVTTVAFDSGGENYDDAHSVNVKAGNVVGVNDQIYVSGFVDRTCEDGVGVVKLTDTGALDHSFGSFDFFNGHTGKLIIGGANPPTGSPCSLLSSASATYANDATLANGKLAIAGFVVSPPFVACTPGSPCREDDVDGMVAVIDTEHGDIDSYRIYPYVDTTNGSRTRHSGFWGIAESGNGTFTATGDVRFFQSAAGQPAGDNQYGTLRITKDIIFAHGFE